MVDSTGLEPVWRVSSPVLSYSAVLFCVHTAGFCGAWCRAGFGSAFDVRLKIRLKSCAGGKSNIMGISAAAK